MTDKLSAERQSALDNFKEVVSWYNFATNVQKPTLSVETENMIISLLQPLPRERALDALDRIKKFLAIVILAKKEGRQQYDDCETIRAALSQPEPEVVTVEEFTDEMVSDGDKSDAEYLAKRYPHSLIIKGDIK